MNPSPILNPEQILNLDTQHIAAHYAPLGNAKRKCIKHFRHLIAVCRGRHQRHRVHNGSGYQSGKLATLEFAAALSSDMSQQIRPLALLAELRNNVSYSQSANCYASLRTASTGPELRQFHLVSKMRLGQTVWSGLANVSLTAGSQTRSR